MQASAQRVLNEVEEQKHLEPRHCLVKSSQQHRKEMVGLKKQGLHQLVM